MSEQSAQNFATESQNRASYRRYLQAPVKKSRDPRESSQEEGRSGWRGAQFSALKNNVSAHDGAHLRPPSSDDFIVNFLAPLCLLRAKGGGHREARPRTYAHK